MVCRASFVRGVCHGAVVVFVLSAHASGQQGACCFADLSCGHLTEAQCVAQGGSYRGDGTSCPVATLVGPGLIAIPDNSPAGVSPSVAGPPHGLVSRVRVFLNITHTWVGDLCVRLSNGFDAVQLIARPGFDAPCDGTGCCGCSENNYQIWLADDDNQGPIDLACQENLTGTFAPDEPLSAFIGDPAMFSWILHVSDNAGGDVGILFEWRVEIELSCNACGNVGSCFEPHSTPGCSDADCCGTICASDPYCCNVEWDGLCAGDALFECGAPACAGATSYCFQTHDTGGCQELVCCNLVCAIDPFCCYSQWDSICVDEAHELCPNPACSSGGPCLVAHGAIGCVDPECCDTVCEFDPWCCEMSWDDFCVSAAHAFCSFCTGDVNGTGAVDVDDLVTVILDWGCLVGCVGDTDGDGDVDVDDLIGGVILNWGPCP